MKSFIMCDHVCRLQRIWMEDKFNGIMSKINMLFASGIAKSLGSVVFNQSSMQPPVIPGTIDSIQQPSVTELMPWTTQQSPVTPPIPNTTQQPLVTAATPHQLLVTPPNPGTTQQPLITAATPLITMPTPATMQQPSFTAETTQQLLDISLTPGSTQQPLVTSASLESTQQLPLFAVSMSAVPEPLEICMFLYVTYYNGIIIKHFHCTVVRMCVQIDHHVHYN